LFEGLPRQSTYYESELMISMNDFLIEYWKLKNGFSSIPEEYKEKIIKEIFKLEANLECRLESMAYSLLEFRDGVQKDRLGKFNSFETTIERLENGVQSLGKEIQSLKKNVELILNKQKAD